MNTISQKVLHNFIATLFVSFIGTLLGYFVIPPQISFLCLLLTFVILIVALVLQWFKAKNIVTMPLVHFITFLLGISASVVLKAYVSLMGVTWVMIGLGITVSIFISLALYVHYSKKDFSFLGGFLFIGLITLIGLGIANLFIQSSLFELGLAFAGVLIFSGYVLYDVSSIRKIKEDEIPLVVLNLYLDFINLLFDILRIIASIKDIMED